VKDMDARTDIAQLKQDILNLHEDIFKLLSELHMIKSNYMLTLRHSRSMDESYKKIRKKIDEATARGDLF
jgi:hypothetical protein